MSTTFPTSIQSIIDTITPGSGGTKMGDGNLHSTHHNDLASTVVALQTRIGINGETDTATITGSLADILTDVADHETRITDAETATTTLDSATASLDGRVATLEGATPPTLTTGTYTPTLFNTTNMAASTAWPCYWFRIDDKVHVFGRVDVDPTTTGNTVLGMSLPIASNFNDDTELAGCGQAQNVAGVAMGISADAVNYRALFRWQATDIASRTVRFEFSYVIIP